MRTGCIIRLVRDCTLSFCACLVLSAIVLPDTLRAADPKGELDLTVLDAKTKQPIPVRLRIQRRGGRAPLIRNTPRLGNDFTFRDMLTFKLRTGLYQFSIDRGPHFHQRTGTLEVNRDGFDQKTLELPRFVDMRKEGWYGGDLLMQRKRDDLELLLDAEELDLAVVPTWQPQIPLKKQKPGYTRAVEELEHGVADFSGGLAETDGGRLVATGVEESKIDSALFASDAIGFAKATREAGGRVTVLDPDGWDVPALVAHHLVDAMAVLTDDLRLDGDSRKPRGRVVSDDRFKGQHGRGRYAQEIYFHLLNCGLRIAPAAFSGSGVGKCDNPPGYNRVYVACGQDFSATKWWENLADGHSIVSNGPVLRVRVNGQRPGYVFEAEEGGRVRLDVTCNLGTRQKVEYLELIKDGLVVESMRLDKWAKAGGKLPPVHFEQSGWLSVRAFAPGEKNYRVALSAPVYVDFGTPRISRRSAQFFVDWVYERARAIRKLDIPKSELVAKIKEQVVARDFWQQLVDNATDK